MTKRPIVVLADGFVNWSGGIDFFTCSVLALLASYNPKNYHIILVFPEKKFFSRISRFFLRIPCVSRWISYRKIRQNSWLLYFKREGAKIAFSRFGKKKINRKLKQFKAVVALFCWSDIPIECPSIGFYPDLQHKFYPQFFSQRECQSRNRTIETILSKRDYCIILSQDTKSHLERFFPKKSAKLLPIPFSPILLDIKWLDPLPYDVKTKYGIKPPYFMISNQFWIHKGHKTAFEAFSHLIKKGIKVELVCTGKTDDFRAPGYYQELLYHIDHLGIKEKVLILGLIPKREQIELMKGTLGMIQPTLFEGGPGGGSIQNAVALGVPAICSDIPVNREISSEHVTFFKVQDSLDLCLKMEKLLKNSLQQPSKKLLLRRHEACLKQLGDTLLKSIDALALRKKSAYKRQNENKIQKSQRRATPCELLKE